jgi:uncharacterized protein YdeI (YjbR/CyaY-like superfamily)
MEQYDSRVDDYIAKSADFAKPILNHIRELVHKASPLIVETIKWGCPFFDYKGPVCQMVAFKQHAAFGFWKASLMDDPNQLIKRGESSAGSFGRITSLSDLPGDEALTDFIWQAVKLNETDSKVTVKKTAKPKTELQTPDYFISVLNENPKARDLFNKFSPSHKREYLEWIIDAKTEATRQKRIETALEWIGEGKSRNWKYQR